VTPTFTEPAAAKFRASFALVVVVLVALVAVFAVLSYLQGPKLASATVDTAAVVAQPGQQLRLFANQSIAQVTASNVVVSPTVAHSVTTQGSLIAVQFDAPLAYDTTYRVEVRGVTSLYAPQSSTLTFRFTTASPALYYLQRGQPHDSIVRAGLTGNSRDIVYSATGIQDFVVADGVLAVCTESADHTSSLDLVSLTDGTVEHAALPEAGVIGKLDASPSGSLVGFTFTSAGDSITPTYSDTLLTVDVNAGPAVTPVLGLAGAPLRVLGWGFRPGGSSLLALTRDRSLFLVDPGVAGAAASVLPLGQATELGPISRDGSIVTLSDPAGSTALTIDTGASVRLTPSAVTGDPRQAYLGVAEALSATTRLEQLALIAPGGTRFSSVLAVDDGTSSRVVYATPGDLGSIESFSVSPNGQYVAVEVVPDVSQAQSDGYFLNAKAMSTETVIVDIATGAVVRSVEGFALRW
jgi:hypothetical protein